ncbi:hypothetical protein [Blastococcus sp. SYSU D00820]
MTAVLTRPAPGEATGRAPRPWLVPLLLGLLAAGVLGAAAAFVGPFAALGALGLVLVTVAALFPQWAVYLYLGTTPFLAGIDRDRLIPLIRPNEAVLALLVAGAAIGGYLRYVRGDDVRWRLRPLDVQLGVFVLLSTLWPVAWLLLRGSVPTGAELAALLPICKLVALLVLVRLTITTDDRLLRLARIITRTAAAIGLIAVSQTIVVPGIGQFLALYWVDLGRDATDTIDRGSTTLASSIATGDYVLIGLALLLALFVRGLASRRELLLLGVPLVAGVLASGQFSAWAAAGIVGIGMLRQYPQLRRLAVRLLPVLLLAVVVGLPAFITRLSEFGDGFGVPRSWLGRWDNLTSFYLPGLGDWRWVLGVSPNSVLRAPETWREEIYLEYGYLQFLWVGGVPLLLAFVWLSVAVLRHARRQAGRADTAGAFASALWATWWMVLVLSLIDIHLVLRGVGELLFVGLAVLSGRSDDDDG